MADTTPVQVNDLKRIELNKELIFGSLAGGVYTRFLDSYIRSLPRYIDDAERDFGLDLYERMMRDPTIESSIRKIKVGVLSKGSRLLSRVSAPPPGSTDEAAQAEYDQAERVRAFVEENFNRLQSPIETILYEVMDYLQFGHTAAEQVYEERDGQLWLKTLRVKPRKNFAYVVNEFNEVQGLIGAKFTGGSIILQNYQSVIDPAAVIPRNKFLLISWDAKGGDPRGTSLLRSAYNNWYLKQQTWPQYLKYLAQFGTPSVAGVLPENAAPVIVTDSSGAIEYNDDGMPKVISPEENMVLHLVGWTNGTAIALAHGSELEIIESKGDGEAYIKAFDLHDRHMTRAILIAARSTMEAQHGSRADSETAADVNVQLEGFVRRQIEVSVLRDIIMPLVRFNFGDDTADGRLCPYMALTDLNSVSATEYGNMIANLLRSKGDVIHDSQWPGIYQRMDVPEPDWDAWALERADAAEQARQFPLNFPTNTPPAAPGQQQLPPAGGE